MTSAANPGTSNLDFKFEGARYRPTIRRPPSESNLRRARERLKAIKQEIAIGAFSSVAEFPDYRFLARLTGTAAVRTCDQVFDEFLHRRRCLRPSIRIFLSVASRPKPTSSRANSRE
jgi:integrase